jgi:hypothetical protein
MRSLFWSFALATGLTLAHSPAVHAQRWGSDYTDQVYNGAPNTYFYDSAPFTHKYNYNAAGILYLNGNPRQLYYADYLDRFQRALKFGYPIPRDPYFGHTVARPGPDGITNIIDPADPNTDPADILPSPPIQRRTGGRGLIFNRN